MEANGQKIIPYNYLIGRTYASLFDSNLKSFGVTIVSLPPNPNIDERLKYHADLSVFSLGRRYLYLAPHLEHQSEFIATLHALQIPYSIIKNLQDISYPQDVQLNIALVGSYAILNPKTVAPAILDSLKSNYDVIAVNQGYTACSICTVDERSIITADVGIAKACTSAGLEVLTISPGYIGLSGFEYGFIGGSAIRLPGNILAFSGKLDKHPDKDRIFEFLKAKNVQPIYLTDKDIFDFGGAVVVIDQQENS